MYTIDGGQKKVKFINYRRTDGQTDKFFDTINGAGCRFFLSVKFATSLLTSLTVGINVFKNIIQPFMARVIYVLSPREKTTEVHVVCENG